MAEKKTLPIRWGSEHVLDKKVHIGRLKLHLSWRNSKGLMGRFGGGWQWKVGIQIDGTLRSGNIALLVMELSWHLEKKEQPL